MLAKEHLDTSVIYVDGNERFTELLKKHTVAMLEGLWKNYGFDRRIGYNLPTLRDIGLERVRLDGSHTLIFGVMIAFHKITKRCDLSFSNTS